jgi:hypothetical protein
MFIASSHYAVVISVVILCLTVSVIAEKTLCSPENLKLVDAAKGEWHLLPDGTFEYVFDHCKLRRFTRDETAKCLKGAHLVFMGDSLSRYFYLSLATLLSTGRWSRKFAKLPAHPNLPRSILSEKDFQNWSRFYHKSNKVLSNEKTSFEICDCFRNDSRKWIATTPGEKDQAQDCRENRHFRFIPESSNLDDQENDVRLSYIQWYGQMPMRYDPRISVYPRDSSFPTFVKALNQRLCPKNNQSFFPMSYHCSDQRAATQELWYYGPQDFVHQLYDCDNQEYETNKNTKCQKFERVMLIPMKTTHLILNIGWHSGLQHGDKNFIPKVVHAAENYFPLPGPDSKATVSSSSSSSYHSNIQSAKVIWRSATYDAVFRSGDEVAKDYYKKMNDQRKFNFFEVYDMTKRLRMIDNLVLGKKYRELKELIKLSASWPKDLPLNISTVLSTWVDTAHLEPWAYEEIHTVYLNSVCPIQLV